MEKFTSHTGVGVPLRAQQRGHRPDHPGGLPQAGHADRLRGRAVRRVAQRPRLRAEQGGVRRGLGARGGPDFGTGSSREHAVWALQNFGFKAVISPRFADIFRGNSGKSGLVAPRSTRRSCSVSGTTSTNPGATITVDLESRTVRAGEGPDRIEDSFDIDDYTLASAGGPRRYRHHARPRRPHRVVRGHAS